MVRHTRRRAIPLHDPVPDDEGDQRDTLSRRLPTELIMEIFAFCPPTVVSIACKHWREIALSTSHVWTGICLYSKIYESEQLKDLRQILLRSCALPLFIFFKEWYGELAPVTAEALAMIKEQCYRWTSVRTSVSDNLLRTFFALPMRPPLEKITITYGNLCVRSLQRCSPDLAPTPSTVFLDSEGTHVECAPFAWSRVNTFSGRMRGEEFARVVQHASCLEKLTVVSFHYDYHRERPVGWHTVHTSLKVLEVLETEPVWNSGHLASLFNSMTLPALESLHLPTDGKHKFSFVQPFLLRSKCPLTYLSLTHYDDLRNNTFPLYEVLCTVPSLEKIRLFNMGKHSFIFLDELRASTGLKVSEGEELPFLPNLKHAFVQLKSKPAWIFQKYTAPLFPPDEPDENVWYRPFVSIEILCKSPARTRYRGIHIDESGLETARKLERLQRRGCTAKLMVKDFDEASPYDYASHVLHQMRGINPRDQR